MRYVLVFLLLSSCAPEGAVSVFFCPQENCVSAFANISDASCAFYKSDLVFTDRLLVDHSTYKGNGTAIYHKGLMHHKFCTNGKTVVTGSYNPAQSEAKNFNDVVVLHSPILARAYLREWERVRTGKGGVPSAEWSNATHQRKVVFCRVGNCQKELLRLIEGANTSIQFLLFSFTDKYILEALKQTSVPVQGMLEPAGNKDTSAFLRSHGIDVKIENTAAKLHHKLWIIDDYVVTGSYNPTNNGNLRNDENMLILRDKAITEAYKRHFDGFWGNP